jgi:ketosteroid isomerase-like protein
MPQLAQLTRLADRTEMAALTARLTHLLDGRHFEPGRVRVVYTDDVVVTTVRGTLHGLDAVRAHLARTSPADERTRHFNADVLVELDGDSAEVTVNQLVAFFRADQPPHRTAGVRCTYGATRTPDGWRFARATIAPAWIRAA